MEGEAQLLILILLDSTFILFLNIHPRLELFATRVSCSFYEGKMDSDPIQNFRSPLNNSECNNATAITYSGYKEQGTSLWDISNRKIPVVIILLLGLSYGLLPIPRPISSLRTSAKEVTTTI